MSNTNPWWSPDYRPRKSDPLSIKSVNPVRVGLDNAQGDDYLGNLRSLADLLVRSEGGGVVVGGLPNSRTGRISIAKLNAGLALRDELREIVVDLLTCVLDEVQKRFVISSRYLYVPGNADLSPDTMLGAALAREVLIDAPNRPETSEAGDSEPVRVV